MQVYVLGVLNCSGGFWTTVLYLSISINMNKYALLSPIIHKRYNSRRWQRSQIVITKQVPLFNLLL
jgi:hypothetical protein